MGERLLEVAWTRPHSLDPQQRTVAAELLETAMTGKPAPQFQPGGRRWDTAAMMTVAKRLFLVNEDLAPLLVLGVGLTGRNGETLKELPATHQILDGRAVAVELVRRRRGAGNSHQTVHWEIGRPNRQLHTPAATTCSWRR